MKVLWRRCQGHLRASRCQSSRLDIAAYGMIHGCVKFFREKDWRPTVWEMKDEDTARSANSDMGSIVSRWMAVVSVALQFIYSFATWMFLSCFLRFPIFFCNKRTLNFIEASSAMIQISSATYFCPAIFAIHLLFCFCEFVDHDLESSGEIGWVSEAHPSLFYSAGGVWFEFSREIGWAREAHSSLFRSVGIGWRCELLRSSVTAVMALPARSRHVVFFVRLCSFVLLYLDLLFKPIGKYFIFTTFYCSAYVHFLTIAL